MRYNKRMEVISSQALWKDYDRKSLPLNESIVSEKTENGISETRLYFSGAAASDGITRIFARLVRPDINERLPVVIVMGDLYDDVDKATFTEACGRAVLYVDYSGEKKAERFTMYPESMSYAQPEGDLETLDDVPAAPQKTCWYAWATVLLRAVTYAESRDDLDPNAIAAVGIGTGASAVWKAAAVGAIKCGVVINEFGGRVEDTGFRAALDSVSYAAHVTVPVLSMCCSNAFRQSLDEVNETVAVGEHCLINVRPRAFRGVDTCQTQTVRLFLQTALAGGELPTPPKISLRGSEGALYCELTVDGEIEEARLYTANSTQAPEMRNWQKTGMQTLGEGQYFARVVVHDATSPVYAFAWVSYKNGMTLCSPMNEVTPSALGIKGAECGKNRLIYDGDMGVDDWIAGDGGEAEVDEGPFGISGVGADEALYTFKLSDWAYRGEPGYVLQMLVYSETDQEIAVKLLTKAGEVYFALRSLKRNDGWVKLNFDVHDFKSGKGTLDSWDRVATVRLTFSGRVIISNMLWV